MTTIALGQPIIPEPERARVLARQVLITSLVTGMAGNAEIHAAAIETQAASLVVQVDAMQALGEALTAGNVAATQAALAAAVVIAEASLAAITVSIASLRVTQTTGTHVTRLKTILTDQYNPRLV